MKVTVLGSGTAVINSQRHGPGYLVETESQSFLLDCGWGVQESLLQAKFDPQQLDHILITHSHADHMGALPSLLQSLFVKGVYFPEAKRQKSLNLHGYLGFSQDYQVLRSIFFPEMKEDYMVEVTEYQDQTKDFGGVSITGVVVPHIKELQCLAYRLDYQGKSVVYSGDCGYNPALIKLADGADLLICEACIPSEVYLKGGPRPNHMSPQEAGQIATRSKVKQLMLCHLYDVEDPAKILAAAQKEFTGLVEMAKDQLVVEV